MRLVFGIRRLLLSPSSSRAVKHGHDRCTSSNPVANPAGGESVASTRIRHSGKGPPPSPAMRLATAGVRQGFR
jgi:hypothetical protein